MVKLKTKNSLKHAAMWPLVHWADVVVILSMSLIAGCGAPLKSADEVASIFHNTEDLGSKVKNICAFLQNNTDSPNLNNVDLGLDACQRAGFQAQDLSLSSGLSFSAIRSDGERFTTAGGGVDREGQLLRLQARTEVWLNRPLLRLAQTFLPMLNDKSLDILGNSGGAAGAEDVDIKVLGEPDFDLETMSLRNLQIDVSSSSAQNGFADVNNRFRVDAIVLDKRYATATVETVTDAPAAQSLLHRGKIVLFVVPHAGDVYVDLTIDLTLHSFGVDAAFQQELLKMLGELLKKIPQMLTDLEAKARRG